MRNIGSTVFSVIFWFIFAMIFLSILTSVWYDDLPYEFKIFIAAFIMIIVTVAISAVLKKRSASRVPARSEQGAFTNREQRAKAERHCPVCYTMTDAKICPRCGNRVK